MFELSIETLEDIARDAGAEIRRIYEENRYEIQTKADKSPVTEADLASNALILSRLREAFGPLPYITEEEPAPKLLESPPVYWLIDPLDGTKEFIRRRETFTVNIALIDQGVPSVAVVYDPIAADLHSAYYGSYRWNGREVPKSECWPEGNIVVSSHSHPEHALASFIKHNSFTEHKRIGSSIKFCLVASRRAHCYPRFHSLRAWDTAAGDGVARAAGCTVLDWETGLPPSYAYEQEYTPAFLVSAPSSPGFQR